MCHLSRSWGRRTRERDGNRGERGKVGKSGMSDRRKTWGRGRFPERESEFEQKGRAWVFVSESRQRAEREESFGASEATRESPNRRDNIFSSAIRFSLSSPSRVFGPPSPEKESREKKRRARVAKRGEIDERSRNDERTKERTREREGENEPTKQNGATTDENREKKNERARGRSSLRPCFERSTPNERLESLD